MTRLNPRWPCPLCLGATMEKAPFPGKDALVVDHCPRCGGVWFELGEVPRLRALGQNALWDAVPRRAERAPARCHACHAHVDRDVDRCPACAHPIRLLCPPCDLPLEPARHGDLTLDVCRRCQGVWFDHHELSAIWTMELNQAVAASRNPELATADASLILVDALIYSPDLLFYGAHAVPQAMAVASEAVVHTPELLGAAADVAGQAAEGVFEAILEIVSGLFG